VFNGVHAALLTRYTQACICGGRFTCFVAVRRQGHCRYLWSSTPSPAGEAWPAL